MNQYIYTILYFVIIVWSADWVWCYFPPQYNPPFPRVGNITFYEFPVGHLAWQNHDLVVTRFYLEEDAKRVKALNPDCILLATNNIISGDSTQTGPVQFDYYKYPPGWFAMTASGTKISMYGPLVMMNVTESCPLGDKGYGLQKFNQWLPQNLKTNTNYEYFDGTFFDTWASDIYVAEKNQIDFNLNGIPDNSESANLATLLWQEGSLKILENLRIHLPDRPILCHEVGELEAPYINGYGSEAWTIDNKFDGWWGSLVPTYKNPGYLPVINFIEAALSKNDFSNMRYGLACACLTDAYYGADEGIFAHRWTYLYDEFLADLGYPTGPAINLGSNVWVRYFDQGAVLANHSNTAQTVQAAQLSGGPFYRIRGGQVAAVNNGSLFDQVTLAGYPSRDGLILQKQVVTLIQDIIVDNEDRNMTSPGSNAAQYSGAWQDPNLAFLPDSINAYYVAYNWGDKASPYKFSAGGNGENTVQYIPSIGVAGLYDVYEWHSWIGDHPNSVSEADAVPFTIQHGYGISNRLVNQQINRGQWNSLGTFYFNSGNNGSVMMSNKANGDVISDAIRFVYRGGSAVSGTVTDQSIPNLAIPGAQIMVQFNNQFVDSGRTSETGYYIFAVAPGNYDLLVARNGYEFLKTSVSVSGTQGITEKNIALLQSNNSILYQNLSVQINAGQVYIQATTDRPVKAKIEYRLTGAAFSYLPEEADFQFEHNFVIAGLQEGLPYEFQVLGTDVQGMIHASGLDTFLIPVAIIYVDDSDVGSFSSTGGWEDASQFNQGYQGTSRRKYYGGGSFATWTFQVPVDGTYEVRIYWPNLWGGGATGVPYTVTYSSGTATVSLDQDNNYEQFNLLGIWNFKAGTSYSVKVENKSTKAQEYIYADAIAIAQPGAFTTGVKDQPKINRGTVMVPRVFPNPFNLNICLEVVVSEKGKIQLGIYSMTGKEVAGLINDDLLPGIYPITWQPGKNMPGGIYFLKLSSQHQISIQKIIFLK